MICDANANLGCKDNMFICLVGILMILGLGCIRSRDPSIYPCSLYLKYWPRKVMWTTFFIPSYDFSEALDKIKRILIIFDAIFIIASYLMFFES